MFVLASKRIYHLVISESVSTYHVVSFVPFAMKGLYSGASLNSCMLYTSFEGFLLFCLLQQFVVLRANVLCR